MQGNIDNRSIHVAAAVLIAALAAVVLIAAAGQVQAQENRLTVTAGVDYNSGEYYDPSGEIWGIHVHRLGQLGQWLLGKFLAVVVAGDDLLQGDFNDLFGH